jgi:hypothetical protein
MSAASLLEPRLDQTGDELRAMYGALQLHAATTAAGAGREGDAWSHWDAARVTAGTLTGGYHDPWTMFGESNVKLHAVSISADLSKSAEAPSSAEAIDRWGKKPRFEVVSRDGGSPYTLPGRRRGAGP